MQLCETGNCSSMPSFASLGALSSGYFPIQWRFSYEHQLLPYFVVAFLLLIAVHSCGENNVKGAFPVANPRKWFEFTYWRRVLEFDMSPREHFARYKDEYPNTPYWLNSELGKVLVLPSSMINEIRISPKLSSIAAIQEV